MPVSVGQPVRPPIPEGYVTLSRFERNIARAVSMAFFPSGGAIPVSGEDAGISRFMDRYLSELPTATSIGLRAFLIILEFMPFMFIFKFKRMSRLSPVDREKYLETWQNHRIFWLRAAMMALKAMGCMGYFSDQNVRREIGYYTVCENGKRRKDI